jgi:hypothetical protein
VIDYQCTRSHLLRHRCALLLHLLLACHEFCSLGAASLVLGIQRAPAHTGAAPPSLPLVVESRWSQFTSEFRRF